MADYTEIKGNRIQYLDSDPTLTSAIEGQVWYNTATGTLKGLTQIKATSSGGNTPTNLNYPGGVGPTTATLAISGVGPSPIPAHTLCSDYSGYTWTAAATIPVGSRAGYDFGTATAAVYAGGDYQSPGASPTITLRTAEYDGSAWTTTNNINGQGSFGASAGSQTAGLAFGGYNEAQTASSTVTTSYDGTSWTSLSSPASDTNTARNFTRGGGGTQTAAIFSGGNPMTGATEAFDGSSWTSLNSMNTARYGSGFNGTQTLGIYMGGVAGPGRVNTIEEWDGVNWSTSPATLSTARAATANSKGGSATSSLVAGGYTGTAYTTATEEYNSEINSITQAVWSSGGNLSNARAQFASAKHGTQNAGLAFGGYVFGPNTNLSATEEYGGSSWTSGGALPGGQRQMGGTGTQTAALGYGGLPGIPNTTTLEYDGSTWTSGGALPAGASYAVNSAAGTQTAGLRAGSGPGSATTTVEEYDGSTWTSANAMAVARANAYFDGAQTAGIITAGEAPAAPDVNSNFTRLTEEYDGTSWASGTSSLFFYGEGAVSGGSAAQSSWMVAGGNGVGVTNNTAATQEYDGTAFTNTANLATSRRQLNGGGTQAAGLVFGGTEASTSSLAATEEYTASSSAATASTLTTS